MTGPGGDAGATVTARPLEAVVRDHAARLAAVGIPSADHEARVLARHALGVDAVDLVTATVADLPAGRLGRLADLVDARERRVPLQHLTGEVGFRDLTLRCRPGVFVPRVETEVLAGAAAERARASTAVGGPVVLEPCTGTGAVGLALAHEVAGVRVVATDVSATAVDLARDNLRRVQGSVGLARGARVEILHGDLLEPVPAELEGTVDVLVANPPYLTESERLAAPVEVRDHEPRDGLVGDPGGHAIVDRLVDDARRWLRPGAWLLLEVHEHRAVAAAGRARARRYDAVEVVADLTGRDRFLVARRPEREDGR